MDNRNPRNGAVHKCTCDRSPTNMPTVQHRAATACTGRHYRYIQMDYVSSTHIVHLHCGVIACRTCRHTSISSIAKNGMQRRRAELFSGSVLLARPFPSCGTQLHALAVTLVPTLLSRINNGLTGSETVSRGPSLPTDRK